MCFKLKSLNKRYLLFHNHMSKVANSEEYSLTTSGEFIL